MSDAAEPPHTYLIEHYWPGVTADQFQTPPTACATRPTSSRARARRSVSCHSTLVPEDEAAFCVFAAESPEVVETAYRRANVPFERIVDALS